VAYISVKLEGNKLRDVETEIRFAIATERVSDRELVRFYVSETLGGEYSEKTLSMAIRVLKSIKKERGIQAFATSEQLKTSNTEAAYLLNKYPEIALEGTASVFVKI